MEEKIIQILSEIDDEIVKYDGEDLYLDGVIDSFVFIEIIERLEECFDISIAPELVDLKYFSNKSIIIETIKNIVENTDG